MFSFLLHSLKSKNVLTHGDIVGGKISQEKEKEHKIIEKYVLGDLKHVDTRRVDDDHAAAAVTDR